MNDYAIITKYGELKVVDAKTLKPLTGERLKRAEKAIERDAVATLKEIQRNIGG